jgi:hypothetical protein
MMNLCYRLYSNVTCRAGLRKKVSTAFVAFRFLYSCLVKKTITTLIAMHVSFSGNAAHCGCQCVNLQYCDLK